MPVGNVTFTDIRAHREQNTAMGVHVVDSILSIVFCNKYGTLFPDRAV
jgi:hypothetical protein